MAEMIRAAHPGEVAILDGIADVASGFDLILCDVWGVLHDGVHAHRGASDALTRFRALPGARPRRVVLLSNAPRPGHSVQGLLDGFGVPRTAYDAIVTSGDLTRRLMAERAAAPMHHLGPDRDLPIFDGLDLARGGRTRPPTWSSPASSTTRSRRRRITAACSNPGPPAA